MTITCKNNIINISVLNYTRSKFCLSVTIFQKGTREGENNYHKTVSGVIYMYFFWNSLQNIILVVLSDQMNIFSISFNQKFRIISPPRVQNIRFSILIVCGSQSYFKFSWCPFNQANLNQVTHQNFSVVLSRYVRVLKSMQINQKTEFKF